MFEAFALGSVLQFAPMRFLLNRAQRQLEHKAFSGKRAVEVLRFREPTLVPSALLAELGRLHKRGGAKRIDFLIEQPFGVESVRPCVSEGLLKPLDLLIRPRQPGFEFCLAPSGGLAFSGRVLRHAREVADSRLMLAPSLVAGRFHLSQLDDMASAFCLGLSPLALEVRLMLRALCSRCRQRRVVPFLLIPECSTGAGNLLLEGATRLALLLEQPLERRLALG